MSISINCQCGRKMLISEELEGLPVRCPNCGRRHLVPKEEPILVAKPIEPKKPYIKVAKPVCKNCKHEIDVHANFCPNCGVQVLEVPEKLISPPKPVEDLKDRLPIKPEIFPGPFKGKKQNLPFETPNRIYAFEPRRKHKNRYCHNKNHRVKQIMNEAKREENIVAEKEVSGIAKFSFFSAFISLVLALLSILVVSNKFASIEHISMHNLQIGMGMMKVSMIFAIIGGFSAFLALFHFSYKRFLLIFLSVLFILGTISICGHTLGCHRMIPRHDFPELEELPAMAEYTFKEEILEPPFVEPSEIDGLDKYFGELKDKIEQWEELGQNETSESFEDEQNNEENNNNEPPNNGDVKENRPSEDF